MKPGFFEIDQSMGSTLKSTGIDEVGRGCLAGPVVVASVTWHHFDAAKQDWFAHLTDSKQLDGTKRAALFAPILAHAQRVRVTFLSHMVVDLLNILQATLHGFELVAPAYDASVPLFLDGNQQPAGLPWGRTLVKGDSRQSAVAAASVVAKVSRDALMIRLGKNFPQYGFGSHMGYATAFHRNAIRDSGPCIYHRKSFSPISQLAAEETLADTLWLEKVQAAPEEQLAQAWASFCGDYLALSLSGARRVMRLFHQRGLAILPSPRRG